MTAFTHFSAQRSNPEFQSAIVRLLIWLFLFIYIGLGAATDHYHVRMEQYYTLFFSFLVIFLGLFASVLIRPVWVQRQYAGLVIDIAATSFSIFLTRDAVSPIFMFYIWIFVSYGTRYGREHLLAATILSLIAYSLVVSVLGGWKEHVFEANFFLLLLAILPMYQYSLLKKLHHARKQAEAANHARGRFLATMTHELRTPLSGITGMANIMDESLLNDQQREQLTAIRYSADKLQQLIGNILDFSRIDAERLEPDQQPFGIRDAVTNVCQSLNVKADEKGLKLSCHVHSGVPEIMSGDSLRLSQVLMNLIGNAIKFTDRGKVFVEVSCEDMHEKVNEKYLLIEVSDTGIGIAEDKLPTIFDAFRQVDDSSTRRFGGTGLGTAISKKLIELMGGDITVSSELGKGSVFLIRLPLRQAERPLQRMANSQEDIMRSNVPHQAKKILVAEDDPISAQLLSILLGNENHDVVLVEDGRSALQEARTGSYDMAFVDLHMPDMDGIEFTSNLRKGSLKVRNMPVFALTANASEEARSGCLQAGVNEFLVKPVTSEAIARLVTQYG